MTKYVIFRKHDAPAAPTNGTASVRVLGGYELIGEHEGSNPQAAVRAAILAMPEADRAKASTETFAATAASAWNVLSPKVDTKTTVTFA